MYNEENIQNSNQQEQLKSFPCVKLCECFLKSFRVYPSLFSATNVILYINRLASKRKIESEIRRRSLCCDYDEDR